MKTVSLIEKKKCFSAKIFSSLNILYYYLLINNDIVPENINKITFKIVFFFIKMYLKNIYVFLELSKRFFLNNTLLFSRNFNKIQNNK